MNVKTKNVLAAVSLYASGYDDGAPDQDFEKGIC